MDSCSAHGGSVSVLRIRISSSVEPGVVGMKEINSLGRSCGGMVSGITRASIPNHVFYIEKTQYHTVHID